MHKYPDDIFTEPDNIDPDDCETKRDRFSVACPTRTGSGWIDTCENSNPERLDHGDAASF
jgi:hypothetical protein